MLGQLMDMLGQSVTVRIFQLDGSIKVSSGQLKCVQHKSGQYSFIVGDSRNFEPSEVDRVNIDENIITIAQRW